MTLIEFAEKFVMEEGTKLLPFQRKIIEIYMRSENPMILKYGRSEAMFGLNRIHEQYMMKWGDIR